MLCTGLEKACFLVWFTDIHPSPLIISVCIYIVMFFIGIQHVQQILSQSCYLKNKKSSTHCSELGPVSLCEEGRWGRRNISF